MHKHLTGLRTAMMITAMASLAVAAAHGEYRKEKDLKLEAGGRFVIEAGAGSVKITGQSGSGARVVVTSNRDDLENLFELRFDESVGTAEVTLRRRHEFRWPNHLWIHFNVLVPYETGVDVKTGGGSVETRQLRRDAALSTSGGSITTEDLQASLDAHTAGGSITLRHVTGNARVNTSGGSIEGDDLGGTLDARTSGGSIRFDNVRGDLVAHTSGGPIRIGEAGGRVDARTSGGEVDVNFAKGNSRGGEVETSGGGVRVALDPSANLNLEASASSGTVATDLPIKVIGTLSPSRLRGTIGSGGERLMLRSDGGGIRIEAR